MTNKNTASAANHNPGPDTTAATTASACNDIPEMPFGLSVLPVVLLLGVLILIIVTLGPDSINSWSPIILLSAAAVSLALTAAKGRCTRAGLRRGLRISASQILPAVPMLALIGLVSTTWMLGGVVPTLIDYGLNCLSPTFFPVLACLCCAVVSLLTGSSWTTIATIGVALLSIGTLLGYPVALSAGAIISGAYFGDKISPLSDTTVVASSSVGVDLFTHIRYMLVTTTPAFVIGLIVFAVLGLLHDNTTSVGSPELLGALRTTFNISPWTLIVPAVTCLLIVLRVNTNITLAVSAALGAASIWLTQPHIAEMVDPVLLFFTDTAINSGNARLDDLAATSGVMGMMPTICLVLCAMIFGAAMIGTGMLNSIAHYITRRLRRRTSIVGATVASGLFLNSCTADQYLSLIVGANMYRDVYDRFGMEPRLLSRSLEDSVSVTSVLIPWNSCGVTQSAVLGVATVAYLPFCFFNYLSPLFSIIIARLGYRIPAAPPVPAASR